MEYETMLMEYENNLVIKEKPLMAYDGLINGNRVLIRRNMTQKQKACVLAEEVGHYYTTAGNILDLSDIGNRKQECDARLWAYDKLIGLSGIIKAYERGCKSLAETADYLNVTEDFLSDALIRYESKYGTDVKFGMYEISFTPVLNVRLENLGD